MVELATSGTIGMKIDAVIASLSEIPVTYQLFAGICIIFSYMVLNSSSDVNVNTSATDTSSYAKAAAAATNSVSKSDKEEPEPKWHILKILNIAAVIGFVTSVCYFAYDATTYINDSNSLMKFLILWSTFLCYFFGFFGISFVDSDELFLRDEQQQHQQQQLEKKQNVVKAKAAVLTTKDSTSLETMSPNSRIHPPASCTPVCTDPPSKSESDNNNNTESTADSMDDDEWANMVLSNKVKDHQLEKKLDPHRAVQVRRLVFQSKLASLYNEQDEKQQASPLKNLPYEPSLDYSRVFGANCEIVVGYIPLPVGMVGPLTLNNETVYFPMATTEGCLVASTNRGCKAISQGSGAHSTILRDGITRAPCVRMNSAREAAQLKLWIDEQDNFSLMKKAFESTTKFGKLTSAKPIVAGRNVYIRLVCFSGDAMGMNMISKGALAVIDFLRQTFPSLHLVALSGNVCTDKKASGMNWIEGRGKSVVVEATIPKNIVQTTLKTKVKTMVDVNRDKNFIGSAVAASIGGFNAHASNIVTAVFLATGQDPAQNVESSNCITIMEETEPTEDDEGGDLWISCTMPSIEVGTVGGGTSLPAQKACLKVIGCDGSGRAGCAGENAKKLAHVVAAATLAGELSLMAALSANTLVQAHMQHNRKPTTAGTAERTTSK